MQKTQFWHNIKTVLLGILLNKNKYRKINSYLYSASLVGT